MGITVGMKGGAETLCEREDTAREVGSGDLLVYATHGSIEIRGYAGYFCGHPSHI